MINIKRFTLAVVISILTVTTAFSQTRNLRVGAARVDMTPPPDPNYPPPTGKYDHEKLYIRAIVLDNGETRAALIGYDVTNIDEIVWSTVTPILARELDCPVENIIMSTTHNHSGIKAGPPGQTMSPDANGTIEAIINIVREAKGRLQPARVGFGTGAAYLNVNRDAIKQDTRLWGQIANLDGPSDKTVAVVMFKGMDDRPIAAYINYAMHPVSAYLSGITSSDFSGAASCYVEKAFGNNMVMVYTQGASGDQNPLWLRPGTNAMASRGGIEISGFEMNRDKIETPLREGKVPYGKLDPLVADNLEHWMDAMGTILGEEIIRVMTGINQLDSEVRIWGVQDMLTYPGRVRVNTSEGREGANGTYEDGPPVDLRVGFLGIGNIALTTINAEVYNIIAQHLKKASPMTNTVFVTIANGRAKSGYIINDEAYGRNTFQALGARIKPGYAEQGIVNKMVSLIKQFDNIK